MSDGITGTMPGVALIALVVLGLDAVIGYLVVTWLRARRGTAARVSTLPGV